MSNELEARVARLERVVTNGLAISLAEHDDPDQAEARAAQLEADEKDAEKQTAAAEKEAEKAAAADPAETDEAAPKTAAKKTGGN